MKVLLADDGRTARMVLKNRIEAAGHEVITGENGREAVELFLVHRPDLVLLDVIMPVMDGIEAAQRIRALCDQRGIWIPIVFLTAMGKDRDLARGIEAGGDDYLIKPVSEVVLNAKLKAMQRIAEMRRQLEAASDKLRQLTELDGLTGIANRRRFNLVYAREYRRVIHDAEPLTLMVADIDHFKTYNDYYGHQAGDQCLKRVAVALEQPPVRSGDLVARYGGEEFVVLFPRTPLEAGFQLAEQIRQNVEALKIPHERSSAGEFITLSIGLATLDRECAKEMSASKFFNLADQALYQAKHNGRNRVEIATF
jgi:diguanylate cyclase (GGDEF)-like protein